MVRSVLSIFVLALWVGAGHAAAECSDPVAAGNAHRQIEVDCSCSLSPSHGAFMRCARDEIRSLVIAGLLPADCVNDAKRCLSRSTCGKPPGTVTCCQTSASGASRCSVKRNAGACRAPGGGSACAGVFASCCDSCAGGGCAAPTTTTSSSTTTTLPPTATEGCCVGDFAGQPIGVPEGTCAVEAAGPPNGVQIFASTCLGLGSAATWSETRCPDPLCGPPAGCCANVSSFAGTSVGFFGDIAPDGGAGATACVMIGGTPLPGRCP